MIRIEGHPDRKADFRAVDVKFAFLIGGEIKRSDKVLRLEVARRAVDFELAAEILRRKSLRRLGFLLRRDPSGAGQIDVRANGFRLPDPLAAPIRRIDDALQPSRRFAPSARDVGAVPNANLPIITLQRPQRRAVIFDKNGRIGRDFAAVPNVALVRREFFQRRRDQNPIRRLRQRVTIPVASVLRLPTQPRFRRSDADRIRRRLDRRSKRLQRRRFRRVDARRGQRRRRPKRQSQRRVFSK